MDDITKLNYKAQDIANFFLSKPNHKIDNLKLQKLVYIAYGWALGQNIKLFDDRIEAWMYGPVIPNLYYKYRKYFNDIIPKVNKKNGLKDYLKTFLDNVYDVYNIFDPARLIHITHTEGTPWADVYESYMNNQIPDEIIRSYYKKKWDDILKKNITQK